jgi:hypothetical protein
MGVTRIYVAEASDFAAEVAISISKSRQQNSVDPLTPILQKALDIPSICWTRPDEVCRVVQRYIDIEGRKIFSNHPLLESLQKVARTACTFQASKNVEPVILCTDLDGFTFSVDKLLLCLTSENFFSILQNILEHSVPAPRCSCLCSSKKAQKETPLTLLLKGARKVDGVALEKWIKNGEIDGSCSPETVQFLLDKGGQEIRHAITKSSLSLLGREGNVQFRLTDGRFGMTRPLAFPRLTEQNDSSPGSGKVPANANEGNTDISPDVKMDESLHKSEGELQNFTKEVGGPSVPLRLSSAHSCSSSSC